MENTKILNLSDEEKFQEIAKIIWESDRFGTERKEEFLAYLTSIKQNNQSQEIKEKSLIEEVIPFILKRYVLDYLNEFRVAKTNFRGEITSISTLSYRFHENGLRDVASNTYEYFSEILHEDVLLLKTKHHKDVNTNEMVEELFIDGKWIEHERY